MSIPRSGPCAPWISGDELVGLPSVVKAVANNKSWQPSPDELAVLCAQSAMAASEILFALSGRQFTGLCGPVMVRPVNRPVDQDQRMTGPWGPWSGTWGGFSGIGPGIPMTVSHYGPSHPPEIELGVYPVRQITLVKIDGVTIPSAEYELRDHRTLVRIRPTASTGSTERYGWPTSQVPDLPDTEPGTFSVSYTYGQPPPEAGRIAAVKLGEFLLLPQLGDTSQYPKRVTNVTRQGVSAQVASVQDALKDGSLGIWEVDAFLLAVNPGRLRRQATVFSPDTGRARRTPFPSR